MLKQRVITGVLMAAVLIAAIIYLSPRALVILLAVLTLFGCWEWSNLAALKNPLLRLFYCVLSAGAMIALLGVTQILEVQPNAMHLLMLFGGAAVWWCLAWIFVKTYPHSSDWWGSIAARLLMGWLALLPAWLALVYLRLQDAGEWKVMFLLTLISMADSGAYFSGSKFGKRKLAPAVSPGKSWEGFWGGLIVSIIFALAVWQVLWAQQLSLPSLLMVAALTMAASVIGDLFESMLKRYRGIKDSGNILPGHGGILDRFDSVSAAAPIFVLGLLLTL